MVLRKSYSKIQMVIAKTKALYKAALISPIVQDACFVVCQLYAPLTEVFRRQHFFTQVNVVFHFVYWHHPIFMGKYL